MKCFKLMLHVFACSILITHSLQGSSRQTAQPDILTAITHAENTMKELQTVPSYGKSLFRMARGATVTTLAAFTAYSMHITQKMFELNDPKECTPCRTALQAALARSDYNRVPVGLSEYTFWGTCLSALGYGMYDFGKGWVELFTRYALEDSLQKQTNDTVQAIRGNGRLADVNTRLSRLRTTYEQDSLVTLSLTRISNALTLTEKHN